MYHFKLTTVLGLYEAATPGVEGGDNATVILGDAEEPQPDLILRILSEFGGRTRTTPDRNYITGPPELVIEIAHSSVAIDLHAKKDDYQRTGVLEYIVVCLEEQEVRWFDLPSDRQLALDPDGILRARVFPGLWIDTAALFRQDTKRLTEVAQQGLAAPEHAEFAQRLETSRSSAESP